MGRRWQVTPLAVVAFALVTVIGSAFALLTPLLFGPDEPQHFGRAWQVAHGGLMPQRIPDVAGVPAYGGDVPAAASVIASHGTSRQWSAPKPEPVATPDPARTAAERSAVPGPQKLTWFTNTAAYAASAYAPAAVAARIGEASGLDLGHTMRLMRLAGVITYAAAAAIAVQILARWRLKFLVFAAAVVPSALFQSGTITADTMTSSAAVIFSALIVRAGVLRAPLTRLQIALLGLTALTIPVTKPSYAPLLLALVVVAPQALSRKPSISVGEGDSAVAPESRVSASWRGAWPQVAGLGALGLVSAGLAAWWLKVSAPTTEGMGLVRGADQAHTVRPADQMDFLTGDALRTLKVLARTVGENGPRIGREIFSQTGYNVEGSFIATTLAVAALVLALGISERLVRSRWVHLLLAVAVVGCLAAVTLALALSFTPVGNASIRGIQGRYVLPVLPLLLVLLARVVPFRIADGERSASWKHAGWWVVGLSTLAAVVALTKFAYFMYVGA